MDNAKQAESARSDKEHTLICPSGMTAILKLYMYEFI